MKLSFTTMATPELSIAEQVAAAKKFGFHGIDLRVIERGAGEIPIDLSENDVMNVLKCTEDIQLPTLLCYNEKLQAGFERMVASIQQYTKLACRLRIPAIRIFTGKVESEADMQLLVRVIKTVLELDTTGTHLAIQNHVNCSVTIHQALELCERICDSRVSVILSADNAILEGEDFWDAVPELAKYVSQVYIADLDARGHYVFPGTGIVQNDKILQILYDHEFDGYVTFKWEKCWHPELPSYDTAFGKFRMWVEGLPTYDVKSGGKLCFE